MPDAMKEAGPSPSAPNITIKDLAKQFWADIYGKEVQSANTYSYTWIADQTGHLYIGIIANFALTLLASQVLPLLGVDSAWADILGLVLAILAVSFWEYRAYQSSVAAASNTSKDGVHHPAFPLDRPLLRKNAVIASVYMSLGAIAGYGFHRSLAFGFVMFLVILAIAILLALPWLRQKIIWQKAALPYLFRLANVPPDVRVDGAQDLQSFIDGGVPPTVSPRHAVVGGPIGSGRTAVAAGIGTEFAFKDAAVRYIGLDRLREFATGIKGQEYPDDLGPANIGYWPWSKAQVIIVDNIGPFLGVRERKQAANLEAFTGLLDDISALAPVLAKCHSIWVVGDLNPDATTIEGSLLNEFAAEVGKFCGVSGEVLVVELSQPEARPREMKAAPNLEFSARVAQVRKVEVQPAGAEPARLS